MQNFEPTGAAAAMPGSAVPQLKRRLVISACLLIPLFLPWPWRCFRVATAAVPDR